MMQLAGCSNPLSLFLPSCFLSFILFYFYFLECWGHRQIQRLNPSMTASFDKDTDTLELKDRTRHLSKGYIHLIHTREQEGGGTIAHF